MERFVKSAVPDQIIRYIRRIRRTKNPKQQPVSLNRENILPAAAFVSDISQSAHPLKYNKLIISYEVSG